MYKSKITIIIIFSILLLAACGQNEKKLTKGRKVEDFTFVKQNEESYGLKDLKGKVWIANFIFTNCEDVCLPITSNMKKLQTLAKEEEINNIEFVSFSVDPLYDNPKILMKFANKFNANFENWHFLTGYKRETIEKLALNSFKTIVKKPSTRDQVIHATSIYLVNQHGEIIKDYSGLSDIPLEEIINDIKALQ